jgi:polyphenol oxidase
VNDSFRLGPDGVYRCDAFQEFIWQKHGFGTRNGNPEAQVTLRQIHSDHVCSARAARRHAVDGDALVTDEIGVSIGVRTADCVPLLLLDFRNRAVAAIHAGWRGTGAKIAIRALETMAAEFESEPADAYVAIGPCIRECCYEVDQEVASQLAHFVTPPAAKAGKQTVDLAAANRFQLEAAGVKTDRIFDCGLCTRCLSEQFYSYRRHPGEPGRMLSAIARLA